MAKIISSQYLNLYDNEAHNKFWMIDIKNLEYEKIKEKFT